MIKTANTLPARTAAVLKLSFQIQSVFTATQHEPTDATRPIQPGGGTPGTPEHAQTFRAEKPE
jgi:hypothetical protein